MTTTVVTLPLRATCAWRLSRFRLCSRKIHKKVTPGLQAIDVDLTHPNLRGYS